MLTTIDPRTGAACIPTVFGLLDPRVLVARFKYKPGFELSAARSPSSDIWHLRIKAHLPDARGEVSHPVVIVMHVGIPPDTLESVERFKGFVALAIKRFEAHEASEWLRFDGELLDDPHA